MTTEKREMKATVEHGWRLPLISTTDTSATAAGVGAATQATAATAGATAAAAKGTGGPAAPPASLLLKLPPLNHQLQYTGGADRKSVV